MEKGNTTLVLNKETKANLDKLKVHPKETYDQLLERMAELGLESLEKERVRLAHKVISDYQNKIMGGRANAGS